MPRTRCRPASSRTSTCWSAGRSQATTHRRAGRPFPDAGRRADGWRRGARDDSSTRCTPPPLHRGSVRGAGARCSRCACSPERSRRRAIGSARRPRRRATAAGVAMLVVVGYAALARGVRAARRRAGARDGERLRAHGGVPVRALDPRAAADQARLPALRRAGDRRADAARSVAPEAGRRGIRGHGAVQRPRGVHDAVRASRRPHS